MTAFGAFDVDDILLNCLGAVIGYFLYMGYEKIKTRKMEVKVMNEFLKGLKVNYTVSALLCVALGLVLLIWPGTTTQVVCMVLGAALVVYGVLQIVFYLANKDRNIAMQGMMVFGIVVAVIGVWILLKPEMIIMAVPVIVGILIVIHGIHNVVQAIALKRTAIPTGGLPFC